MTTFTIQMRKQCTLDALQEWLNRQQPGLKIIEIVTPNPCEVEITVEDEKDEP